MNISITVHNQHPRLARAGYLIQKSGICGAKNLELRVSEPDPQADERVKLLETGNAEEGPEEGEGVGEEDGVVAVGHVEDALWWVSGNDEILFRCQNAQILARPDVEAPNLAVVGRCQRQRLHAHHVRRRSHQIYRQVDVLQHHTGLILV